MGGRKYGFDAKAAASAWKRRVAENGAGTEAG